MRRNLITGGAGFIGINLAERLLRKGEEVLILDNLSRRNTEKNLDWLKTKYGNSVPTRGTRYQFIKDDVRNYNCLSKIVPTVDVVYHLAGQVAVTTSVANPRADFEANLLGTFNVLEAARNADIPPVIVYSSTNKVYGMLEYIPIIDTEGRYEYSTLPYGINESQRLEFLSPYGCSKGAAEQYVSDYAKIYGLRTIVFRQSCIYGKQQFGTEDQGWVAHFVISAMRHRRITIFGNGKQTRDILYIDDLLAAYELAINTIDITRGNTYNIGGGPSNTISLLELIQYLEEKLAIQVKYSFEDARPGDQKIYVSDIRKAQAEFGWQPRISWEQGLRELINWVSDNKRLLGNSHS